MQAADDQDHLDLVALPTFSIGCFLLDLQAIHDRSQLAENLVGLLVKLELGSDEICDVAKRFRGIEDLIANISRHTAEAHIILKHS